MRLLARRPGAPRWERRDAPVGAGQAAGRCQILRLLGDSDSDDAEMADGDAPGSSAAALGGGAEGAPAAGGAEGAPAAGAA